MWIVSEVRTLIIEGFCKGPLKFEVLVNTVVMHLKLQALQVGVIFFFFFPPCLQNDSRAVTLILAAIYSYVWKHACTWWQALFLSTSFSKNKKRGSFLLLLPSFPLPLADMLCSLIEVSEGCRDLEFKCPDDTTYQGGGETMLELQEFMFSSG